MCIKLHISILSTKFSKFKEFLPDNKPYEAKGGKRVKLEESHSPATDIHAYCFTMLEFFVGTRLAGSHTIKQPPTKTKVSFTHFV